MGTGGGSLESLRALNRLRVVDELRRRGEASRAVIAHGTGLSRSTVSSLVADLQAEGLVVERGASDQGDALPGRPPVLLALDPAAGAVLGIDFGHRHVRVAVSDLSRTVLAEGMRAHDVDHDAAGALDDAAALVEQVLAEAEVSADRVIGVGMGLPGPIDHDRGALRLSSILPAWADLDAAAELERRIGLPVEVENDANLGALAEVTMGAGRNARHAVYLRVSSGIGAGVIIDGRLHRGARGTAGEIGHVLVDEAGAICRCGNRGCLETVAAGPALVELLQRSRGEELTVGEIIELAQRGDAGCARAIADAGRATGRAVAALCNLLNPETVIVGGDVGMAGELFLEPMRAAIERYAIAPAVADVSVVAGVLGERAELLGALALAIAQSEHLAARIAPSPGVVAG